MATKAKAPRWRRRKEDRPTEIVTAALEAFAERGFAATRLDDIARKAGVSKGTLYLYFKDKEELFKAVIEQALLPYLAVAEDMLGHAEGSSAELLQTVVTRLSTAIAGTKLAAIPKLVIAEAGNFPDIARFYYEEVIQRGMRLFAGIIARGQARGEFRAVDPAVAAPILLAPFLVLAVFKEVFEPYAKQRIDPAKYLATYGDIAFRGLLRPAREGV